MKLICAQPALPYYTWQVEVMIKSFLDQGINPNHIHIVCSYKDNVPEIWRKMASHYNTVPFFFYEDTRVKPGYIPSIRPHILHKHWLKYPELEKETVLYHDSDIALFKPLQLTELLSDDKCYLSDTVSYIGAQYIRSKGEQYLDLMSEIVGIHKDLVIAREKHSGGAQYLLKNVTATFWAKVYTDAEALFIKVNEQIKKDQPEHPIQIWCADMWAVLWNLWLMGKDTRVAPQMNFSWATSNITDLNTHQFYHNAGVTSDSGKHFYKGLYINKLPYTLKAGQFDPAYCSYRYAQLIEDTAKITILKN
jgi:hypothetical protein